jgi:hypothetical protein
MDGCVVWVCGCVCEQPVYLPPRSDVNAPDLYIPTMAFFTFALLMGYVLGTIGKYVTSHIASPALPFFCCCVLCVRWRSLHSGLTHLQVHA